MGSHWILSLYSYNVVRNATIEKLRKEWDDDERRKVQYNLKAKNIITSALGMDEYFRVTNCKNAKEMWDTLQVTHEGTIDVKRSRIKHSHTWIWIV